jgi:chromate transporter
MTREPQQRTPLLELAALFLKLGAIGFGGPAAHVALMEAEFVRRRGWLSREEFLDLVGATNLIPGPNSTELAIHIGRLRAGFAGLVVAGVAFMLPAVLSVTLIAWAYVRYGALPELAGLLYAIKPVVLAVVIQALILLARTALKRIALVVVGAAAFAAALVGVHEIAILALAAVGAASIAWTRRPKRVSEPIGFGLSLAMWTGVNAAAAAAAQAAAMTWSSLFLVFLKAGGLLFGSGYVLLAFLRADLVERLHWLTDAQLLDAIAVGQVTPGPVFSTATFVGYVLGGISGASIATVGIFLPAFVFVAATAPFIHTLRRSRVAAAMLDTVNVASLALMAAVTMRLARDAVVDITTLGMATVVLVLLVRYRVNSAWLIIGAAFVGLSRMWLR